MAVNLAKDQKVSLLKITEVAQRAHISYPTARRRIQSLGIPLYTKGTNTRVKYIREEDLPGILAMGEEIHLWKPSLRAI